MTLAASAIIADFIAGIPRKAAGALVIGLCGAQGSGKSTVAGQVAADLAGRGLRAAVLSLDDLYLTKAERRALARGVHPLLATRGPPGTHDVSWGAALLARLKAGEPVRMPVFDKIADDRLPEEAWCDVGPADVVLFEGWCVGAAPEPADRLAAPVNTLEREEDADGVWRAFVNRELAETYPALFSQLDRLIMLRAPNFDVVARWRLEQEASNLARRSGGRPMDEAAVRRFIQHYERLTRWVLEEVPARADLVISLDESRQVRT